MNRIMGRTRFLIVLILILALGFLFFLGDFLIHADRWILFPGSPHLYNAGNLGCGIVTDRDGILLMDMRNDRIYSENADLRASTIHWLGDRKGNISAPALSEYALQISGYDFMNGVYIYGGSSGIAQTSLSATAQLAARKAMGSYKGTVAVYNYKTGEILCAVSAPNYDPDQIPDFNADPGSYEGVYLNRFTQSVYIPGSIFKIVTTAAALESIPNILDQSFTCEGVMEFGVDKVTCTGEHGTVDLKSAFAYSCNCAFAQIALQLGGETLTRFAEQFGVLDSIMFDGIQTPEGNIQAAGESDVFVAWSGIGQHKNQVNPCAFMTFIGAIAGDGVGAMPSLVSRITVGDEVTYVAKNHDTGRIMSSKTAQILQELMRNNVETMYGDAYFPGITVCAKSGTAEVGADRRPNGTFAGFIADDRYPLAFMIVVEDSGSGSSVCLPILSEVLQACKNAMDKA